MKKFAIVLAAAMLGGCATGPVKFRASDVRQPQYLRAERKIPLNFPKIQMALFKHKQVCGWAPEFVMDEGQTSFATVYYKPTPTSKDDRTIVVDLTFLQDGSVRAQAYSYYANAGAQVTEAFTAMTNPGVCPGQPIPEKPAQVNDDATDDRSEQ